VAVALGAIILSESLSLRTLLASAAIIVGVMLIIRRSPKRQEGVAVEVREPESIAG
jgi:drug/metabolite transporter (DMT)-like permease